MSTIDILLVAFLTLVSVGVMGISLVWDKGMTAGDRLLALLVVVTLSVAMGGLSSGSKDHVVVSEPLVPVDTLILTRRASDTIPDTLFIYKIKPSERKRSDQVDGHLHREDEGDLSQEGR